MNIFYEESGRFKVARIVQRNDANYQVDTQHGKRSKIKANNVFFEFDANIDSFLPTAEEMAADVDVDLLWQVCDEAELSGHEIAQEYFGHAPSQLELAAILMALYAAPIYFHKKNKGIFKAAPEDVLRQALAAVERKKIQEAQMDFWVDELRHFRLPEEVAADILPILHQPDKQSLTYKAFMRAADELKYSPLALARACGAVSDMAQYLYDGFIWQYFKKSVQAPEVAIDWQDNLTLADKAIQAFSIDDVDTTEIDDAISVLTLPDGQKQVGIHIAAPALAIHQDSEIEKLIFNRMSTVYFPGGKITMLPENWIKKFSLDEGDYRPCVSIYFTVSPDGCLNQIESKVEKVWIDCNLRIQEIEPFFNRDNGVTEGSSTHFPHHQSLQWLHQWVISLQKKRERYEENAPIRYDYSVSVNNQQKVSVQKRERGSPLDTVVSELMILANSTWGKYLDEQNIGGIFRVQPTAGRVRMSTKSEAHIGMGVSHYAWFTSPLRRLVDYINQKQLISLIDEHYPLRFTAENTDLFIVLREFDTTYTAYNDFQSQMEYYYSLVYIQQENIQELEASLLKEDLVRIDGLPIVTRALGIPIDLPPRTRMKLRISEVNLDNKLLSLQYLNAII